MDSKSCISCKKIKTLDNYQTRKRYNLEKTEYTIKYLGNCRPCEKERIKKWKHEKRGVESWSERMTENLDEKECTNCNIIKDISQFSNRTKILGIFPKSHCKKCEMIIIRDKRKEQGLEKRNFHKCDYCENCEYCLGGYRNCEDCKSCEECKSYKKIYTSLNNKLRSCLTGLDYFNTEVIYITGCNLKDLKFWLEYRFNSNMTWENYGSYWEIDHVIPAASFKLTDKKSQQQCFHWTNLQPLEATRNRLKSSKIIPQQILIQELNVKFYKLMLGK